MTFTAEQAEFIAEHSVGPWGSHRNRAADALGVWIWHGERDSAGQPCRYRMRYKCDHTGLKKLREPPLKSTVREFSWTLEWSCSVDDECELCGSTRAPTEVEDLLLDPSICPDNQDD